MKDRLDHVRWISGSRGEAMSLLCRRYGLDLIAVHEGTDRSALVAHVRDRTGHDLVLKRTSSERGRGELAALRAWSDTGLTSRLVAVLEPNLYLAEWLRGPSLAEVAACEPVDARAIGRMLHGLHAVSPPSSLRPVRDRFTVAAHEGWPHLLPALRDLGVAVTAQLTSYEAPHEILLHGDLVPLNVLLTPDGPKIIDPVGYRGFHAWDLAQLAVATEGRGGCRMLPDLLAGYGSTPPLMAETFAWMILFFLQKNLIEDRPAFATNLQPLAEALLVAGDPDAFLRQYCA